MNKNHEAKAVVVEEIRQSLQNAKAAVLVDYRGLTVEEDTQLRRNLRKEGVQYKVLKNTLIRRAAESLDMNELDPYLNGPTAIAFSDNDPVAPARVMAGYANKLKDKFEIKGGFMEGKPVDMDTINRLAAIPPLPILQAQVLGTMLAPITGLAVVLKQIAEKNGAPAEDAAPAEEAPAAE